MRHVQITDRRRNATREQIVFEGTVVVDRRTETFRTTYRQGTLTLSAAGTDILVPIDLACTSICTWPEIKDPIQDAMDEHFNSDAYTQQRHATWKMAA